MLERLLTPRSIAVIGASRTPGKLGYEVYKNCVQFGFKGKVYPVNPRAQHIDAEQCFASVLDVQENIDVAIIVVSKDIVPAVLKECGIKQIPYAVIITAGFRETGEEGKALEEQIKKIAATYNIRIVGPNCLGFVSPGVRLNASFTQGMPRAGDVALISQSGAMCVSILDWAQDTHVGFSHVLTIGNKCDISEIEALEYFARDRNTAVIALYLESIERGSELIALAQRIVTKKPIVLIKSGLSENAKKAVESHTGALAGSREAIEALCIKAGIIQVHSIQEFFDVTLLLASHTQIDGEKLGILTNAGGPGVLAVDSMDSGPMQLAEISANTQRLLKKIVPSSASVHNPIDIIGDATPERYAGALDVLSRTSLDALLVILTPQVMTHPSAVTQAIIRAQERCVFPIVCSFVGGSAVHDARSMLNAMGIPHFSTPERAIRALNILLLAQRQARIPRSKISKTKRTQKLFKEKYLFQAPIQAVEGALKKMDVDIVPSILLKAADDCVRISSFPAVMKIASQDVVHKSAVGGVVLNVDTPEHAQKAFTDILRRVRGAYPKAKIDGVYAQTQHYPKAKDVEMFVGIKNDPTCGKLVICGFGGTDVELTHDIAYAVAPLSNNEALALLSSLRNYPRIQKNDLPALCALLVKLSKCSVQYTGFSSIDLNPVVLHTAGRGYTILDARILV